MEGITIKKLIFVESMSEETPCFSCDVHQHGELIAHVSNRGHGGSNEIRPAKGKTFEDVKFLGSFENDCEIMMIVEEMNIVKKKQSKNFVIKKNDELYTRPIGKIGGKSVTFAQCKKSINLTRQVVKIKQNLIDEGYEVLNTNI